MDVASRIDQQMGGGSIERVLGQLLAGVEGQHAQALIIGIGEQRHLPVAQARQRQRRGGVCAIAYTLFLQILNTDSASGSYLIATFELLEPPDSGLYQVMRVMRSKTFCQYIMDTSCFKYRTNSTSCNNSCTRRSRFQHHTSSTVFTINLMGNAAFSN